VLGQPPIPVKKRKIKEEEGVESVETGKRTKMDEDEKEALAVVGAVTASSSTDGRKLKEENDVHEVGSTSSGQKPKREARKRPSHQNDSQARMQPPAAETASESQILINIRSSMDGGHFDSIQHQPTMVDGHDPGAEDNSDSSSTSQTVLPPSNDPGVKRRKGIGKIKSRLQETSIDSKVTNHPRFEI
jgi:hypothetical protein